MKICMIGEGAQAETHMQALQSIDDVEVVTVAGGIEEDMRAFADKWQIPHRSMNLRECLLQPGVEAVIRVDDLQEARCLDFAEGEAESLFPGRIEFLNMAGGAGDAEQVEREVE